MKPRLLILTALIALTLFHASPAAAEQRLIVRTTNVLALKQACLLNLCQVTQTLDGTLGQLFLVTAPDWVSLKTLESVLRLVSGVIASRKIFCTMWALRIRRAMQLRRVCRRTLL